MSEANPAPADQVTIVESEVYPTAADVEMVLAEFHGDHRGAIAALLSDLATLAGDFEGRVSRGFVHGAVLDLRRARRRRATSPNAAQTRSGRTRSWRMRSALASRT